MHIGCACMCACVQLITTVQTLLHFGTVMFHKTFVSAVLDDTFFVPLRVLTKCVQWGTDVYKWSVSQAHM